MYWERSHDDAVFCQSDVDIQTGHIVNPEMDYLSMILNDFNDMFGNFDWKEPDNVRRKIIAFLDMVAKNEKHRNAVKNYDKQNIRMESERALQQAIFTDMADNMELFNNFKITHFLRSGYLT